MSLMTIDDIAQLFGVERRTVANYWVHKPNFPPPMFAPTRRSRLWSRDEIIAWATPAARKSARPIPGSTSAVGSSDPGAR